MPFFMQISLMFYISRDKFYENLIHTVLLIYLPPGETVCHLRPSITLCYFSLNFLGFCTGKQIALYQR